MRKVVRRHDGQDGIEVELMSPSHGPETFDRVIQIDAPATVSSFLQRMGRTGPVMAFVHPNPMDQSCWIYQMAHMSTWFRCIAIDVPGYGRSPKCRKGVSMNDVAQGCWEAR